MLAPGFLEHVQAMSLLLKQKLAAVLRPLSRRASAKCAARACWSASRPWCPSGDLVDALRDEKLLTVGAGDNVVRLLPPLIVTEAEIERSRDSGSSAPAPRCRRQPTKAAGQHEQGRSGTSSISASCRSSDLRTMLDRPARMKAKLQGARRQRTKPLAGKTLAMIFEKPSTRTRVSFDVGMRQLGGEAIMLTGAEMQLGRGETIADTARVLSRYVDAIMIRILSHDALLELAAHATVPVINGLTRRSHPCQVMADVMTFEEHRGPIKGAHRGLDRRRQQRAGVLGACGASASSSSSTSRPRRNSRRRRR